MNPVISLLNNHDVEIRQKTLPGSIPHSDIANLLDAIALRIEKDVPYQLAIPFDSMVSSMTGKQLTANDKYFVSQVGSIPGGGCILALAGDGVHAPDLSNFLLVNGVYNIGVGIVNQLIFYYDGSSNNYCVSIVQLPAGATITAVNNGPDTTPPVVASIAVLNSNPSQVVITYNEALKTTTVPAPGNFVVTAGGSTATINSVAVSSNTVLLNLASPIIAGSSNFIQYTPGTNKIQDLAGNFAAAIPVNTLITNNVGSSGATQLNAPTGLGATSISATEIDLAWTDTNSSPNDSGYKIYRNASNTFGTATLIATTAANATTYNDTAVPNPSTLYYYWAVAKGDGTTTSDSVASASASATSGAAGPIFANFTSSELSEQPSGSHIYKPVSATGATYNHRGMDAHKLAGTSDGNVITTVDATLQGSGQFVLGLSPSSTALDAYTSFTVAVRPIIGSGVQVFEGGGSAGLHGSVADGNLVRINTNKAAMQATIDVSTDGGTTWTTVYTSANLKVYNGTAYVPVGDVYCHAAVYDDAGIKNTTLTNFS